MIVSIAQIEASIPDSRSLKDKRMAIKSIIEQVRGKFNVSIAEIDNLDVWNFSKIGIACVSNEKRVSESIISRVIDFIDKNKKVVILNYNTEVL